MYYSSLSYQVNNTKGAEKFEMYIALLVLLSLVLAVVFVSKTLQSKPIPGIPLLAGTSVAKQFGGMYTFCVRSTIWSSVRKFKISSSTIWPFFLETQKTLPLYLRRPEKSTETSSLLICSYCEWRSASTKAIFWNSSRPQKTKWQLRVR